MPFRVRTRAATPERPGDDRSAESSGGPTEDRTLGEVDASPASDEEQRQGRDAAHETSELELTPAAPKPPPVVVPRWVQLVLLPLALLGVWALARASGTVLLVLIVASMVALILAPWVRRLERRMPRGLAIPLVYIAGFLILGGIIFLLISPVSTQVTRLAHNFPSIVRDANRQLGDIQHWLNDNGIPVHFQRQGQTALQTLQKEVLKRSGDIVSFSRDFLSTLVTIGFEMVLVFVLSVYLLIYGNQIGSLVRRIMPPGDGTPADDYPRLVQHAVSGYVRGQLLFSLIMGASAALALTIFGVLGIFPDGESYGVFFGAFYGLMEFIPYIGPIIGPLPAVLLGLFHSPITAVWLIVLFVALQQLEGHVVAPQVFRISLRINPIVIILALLLGYELYGIVGALVALPVIAVIRQTVLYLRRHLVLEPWSVSADPGVGLVAGPPDRCPNCDVAAAGDDAFCRNCGASLEPKVRSSV